MRGYSTKTRMLRKDMPVLARSLCFLAVVGCGPTGIASQEEAGVNAMRLRTLPVPVSLRGNRRGEPDSSRSSESDPSSPSVSAEDDMDSDDGSIFGVTSAHDHVEDDYLNLNLAIWQSLSLEDQGWDVDEREQIEAAELASIATYQEEIEAGLHIGNGLSGHGNEGLFGSNFGGIPADSMAEERDPVVPRAVWDAWNTIAATATATDLAAISPELLQERFWERPASLAREASEYESCEEYEGSDVDDNQSRQSDLHGSDDARSSDTGTSSDRSAAPTIRNEGQFNAWDSDSADRPGNVTLSEIETWSWSAPDAQSSSWTEQAQVASTYIFDLSRAIWRHWAGTVINSIDEDVQEVAQAYTTPASTAAISPAWGACDGEPAASATADAPAGGDAAIPQRVIKASFLSKRGVTVDPELDESDVPADEDCAACMCPFLGDDDPAVRFGSVCQHHFHKSCMGAYLSGKLHDRRALPQGLRDCHCPFARTDGQWWAPGTENMVCQASAQATCLNEGELAEFFSGEGEENVSARADLNTILRIERGELRACPKQACSGVCVEVDPAAGSAWFSGWAREQGRRRLLCDAGRCGKQVCSRCGDDWHEEHENCGDSKRQSLEFYNKFFGEAVASSHPYRDMAAASWSRKLIEHHGDDEHKRLAGLKTGRVLLWGSRSAPSDEQGQVRRRAEPEETPLQELRRQVKQIQQEIRNEKALEKGNDYKCCPNCGKLTFKRGGCNHMVCGRNTMNSDMPLHQDGCGTHWNWIQGGTYSNLPSGSPYTSEKVPGLERQLEEKQERLSAMISERNANWKPISYLTKELSEKASQVKVAWATWMSKRRARLRLRADEPLLVMELGKISGKKAKELRETIQTEREQCGSCAVQMPPINEEAEDDIAMENRLRSEYGDLGYNSSEIDSFVTDQIDESRRQREQLQRQLDQIESDNSQASNIRATRTSAQEQATALPTILSGSAAMNMRHYHPNTFDSVPVTCRFCSEDVVGPLMRSMAPAANMNGNAEFSCLKCHLRKGKEAYERGKRGGYQPHPDGGPRDDDLFAHPWDVYLHNYGERLPQGDQPITAAEKQAQLAAFSDSLSS